MHFRLEATTSESKMNLSLVPPRVGQAKQADFDPRPDQLYFDKPLSYFRVGADIAKNRARPPLLQMKDIHKGGRRGLVL